MNNLLRFVLSIICTLGCVQPSYAQWIQSNGPYGGEIHALAISPDGTNMYAGTWGAGVYHSTDNGASWTYSGLTNAGVSSFVFSPDGQKIFVGCQCWVTGVYLSIDNGSSWVNVCSNMPYTSVNALAMSTDGTKLFAGTESGVYLSTNDGSSWSPVSNGLTNTNVWSLAISPDGSKIFAGTIGGGVFLSTNTGSNWTPVNAGLTNMNVYSLAINPISGRVFAAVSPNNGPIISTGPWGARLYRSDDNGVNWSECNPTTMDCNVSSLAISPDGSNIYAACWGSGNIVFRSTDDGMSWQSIGSDMASVWSIALGPDGSDIFLGVFCQGVFHTNDGGLHWVTANTGLMNVKISCFAFSPDDQNIFAGTDNGLFRSPDDGLNWVTSDKGLRVGECFGALAIDPSGANIFAGTIGYGIYLSSDNGSSWTPASNGLTDWQVRSLAVSPDGRNIFAGTAHNGVFISTDNGSHWTMISSGLPGDTVSALAISPDGRRIFAGTYGSGVYCSSDTGSSWTAVNSGLTDGHIYCLAISPDGTKIFAGTANGGVFLSTNDGSSWAAVNSGLPNPNINALGMTPDGRSIFAGTVTSGVYVSTDDGSRWRSVNEGLSNHLVFSLGINREGTLIFIGTGGGSSTGDGLQKVSSPLENRSGGVWRRSVSEMVTGVKDDHNQIPARFALEQNYPNPFNPNTTIRFSLPKSAFVALNIYNTLGQKVATLVSQYMITGSHEIDWNAPDLSSGVYFYRLEAGGYTTTRKLLLLR